MTVQDIQMELLKMSNFNDFQGKQVSDDLIAHPEMWVGFIFDRECWGEHEHIDGIRLRDISQNYWNADTLYIQPKPGQEAALEALAKTWFADEVDYETLDQVGKVLRVWWD